MPTEPQLRPLPRRKRRLTFIAFCIVFVSSLPFLYLYATGYRFNFGERTNIVATGGMYIAAERTGAEIFIDGELVRETRVFRKAFYAQNLEVGTHRVHVQKEGHHTWVKELPVSKHLVTEAQAFNLPLTPQVRVIAPQLSATGTALITTPLLNASTTNEVIATTTKILKTPKVFTQNPEYLSLIQLFGTTSTSSALTARQQAIERVEHLFTATTTATSTGPATTTKEWGGVRLFEGGDDVYAEWVGGRESIPYYYCAEAFPPYSTTTPETAVVPPEPEKPLVEESSGSAFVHPVQTVPVDSVCDPTIKIDRKWQNIRAFDFYPGSVDLVLMSLQDGVYVSEIDNRAWQNMQPLILGNELTMRVSNGQIYVYDGTLIYQILIEEI